MHVLYAHYYSRTYQGRHNAPERIMRGLVIMVSTTLLVSPLCTLNRYRASDDDGFKISPPISFFFSFHPLASYTYEYSLSDILHKGFIFCLPDANKVRNCDRFSSRISVAIQAISLDELLDEKYRGGFPSFAAPSRWRWWCKVFFFFQ